MTFRATKATSEKASGNCRNIWLYDTSLASETICMVPVSSRHLSESLRPSPLLSLCLAQPAAALCAYGRAKHWPRFRASGDARKP